MGKKIFVSYKYSDSKVLDLNIHENVRDFWGNIIKQKVTTTARHYVDKIDKMIEAEDNIFKGEDDGEDLSSLQDSTIGSKLGDKIFDSTVTIVLISKGMKEDNVPEKDQWIPWEVSYSLREQSRQGRTSKTNAVLAVVLPDEAGSYGYFMTSNPACNSITYHTERLFRILSENMFNAKNKESNIRHCNGSKIYEGYPSYIYSVKWEDFIGSINHYVNIAVDIRSKINEYDVVKTPK